MVTKHEAVCLWEDHVGDSGKAPTDEELHAFALAIEAKARKPFKKLVGKWERKAKELTSYGRNNPGTPSADTAFRSALWYSTLADKLKNRLN